MLTTSLLGFPTKVIAEPVEIAKSSNIKVYAFEKVLNRWGDGQWVSFNELINRESHWNNLEQNPNSTAFGIGQFLDSTWALVSCKKTTNAYKQVDCTIDYIEKFYGNPDKAVSFHRKNNYY